ncbi:MAG: hypothetical protein ACRC0S_00190 [Fusobacteriaceae bacterium]
MELREDEVEIKENEKVLTIKDWLKFYLIIFVPILNIIMCIKWLVSDKTNKNLKNYLISSLIIFLIVIGIYGIFIFTIFANFWM